MLPSDHLEVHPKSVMETLFLHLPVILRDIHSSHPVKMTSYNWMEEMEWLFFYVLSTETWST